MRLPTVLLFVLFTTTLFASQDTTSKQRRLHLGVYSSISYAFALNGNKINTNLGNIAFKGRINPGIGFGVRYQQDSSEFALITASIAFLDYTASTSNVIYDNGNEYAINNEYSMVITNAALETSYHKRVGQIDPGHYFSLECGAGVHMLYWAGAVYSADTSVGPYTITRQLESRRDYYFVPSMQVGFDMTVKSPSHKTQYIFGLRSQLYLAKFGEVRYDVQYTSPNNTLNYYFHYAPVILTPKLYVMAVF